MNLVYPSTTGPHLLSRVSVSSLPSLSLSRTREKHGSKPLVGWSSSSIGVKLNCSCVSAGNEISSGINNGGGSDMSEESDECVEVIVVGSRKDAVLDFCSGSPFLSPVLRFWYMCCSSPFLFVCRIKFFCYVDGQGILVVICMDIRGFSCLLHYILFLCESMHEILIFERYLWYLVFSAYTKIGTLIPFLDNV